MLVLFLLLGGRMRLLILLLLLLLAGGLGWLVVARPLLARLEAEGGDGLAPHQGRLPVTLRPLHHVLGQVLHNKMIEYSFKHKNCRHRVCNKKKKISLIFIQLPNTVPYYIWVSKIKKIKLLFPCRIVATNQ
jgi:hypothetical protein